MDRRSVLHGAALSLSLPVVGVAGTRFASMHDRQWTRISTPTSNTLHAVADAATGHVAAGSDGVLLERTDDGWAVANRNGPGGNGSNLTALGVTADGAHVWMAGASGALGVYDPRSGELTDRTAPDGVTNAFTAIAVAGSAGEATVYLADASGQVHASFDGGDSWTHLTPGSGAAINGLDCYGARTGVLVDDTGSVYETTTGTDWRRIGIDDADGRLAAVDADGASDVTVVGTHVYRRTDGWTESEVTDASLHGVAVCPCGCIHAVGSSGTVVHRPGDRSDGSGGWRVSSPTGENLHGVSLGRPHVAVGAGGTVLER